MKNNTQRLTNDIFIERSNIIHNDKFDYSLVVYINNKTKIKIICKKCNNILEQIPYDHLRGFGCSICSGNKKSTTENFINKSIIIHNNKFDYSLVEYKGTHKKVKILCKKCNNVFEQSPRAHIQQKQGCSFCSGTKKLTTLSFIDKSLKTHGDKYDYSLVNYINNKTKVKIICPVHNEFLQRPNDHLSGRGCPMCKESTGELKIRKILEKNNINFIYQKRFKKCINKSSLSFDFYLPKYNICIEFDGKQHYESINFFGGKDGLKNSIKRDKIKNKYCKNNNIILIRIKYNENVEKILNEYLSS